MYQDRDDSSNSDSPSIRRRREEEAEKKKREANLPVQPTRCPVCWIRVDVPERYDPDEYLERKIARCFGNDNPICQVALTKPSARIVIDRVKRSFNI